MKHLKLFFALFAMLALGVGNAWGETVTFTPSNCTNWTSSQAEQTQTIDGITLHSTGAANNTQLRLYSGATHTFTSTVGNITSILFTCTANGTSNYGPGKMSGDGYVASSGKTGEWTGNSATVTLTGGQSRCTSIVVTYTPSSGGSETPGEGGGEDPETPDTGDETGWVATAIGDITASDKVVITMTNSSGTTYAMSNNNGTSNAPTATEVTVVNGKLSAVPAENLIWNINNSSGNLTIYPNGDNAKWLYCTNTNNGVRVGTNTNKVFTIDATSGYLKHTATSRYVGVYNAQDWRCYTNTTGNTADQTLKFYKEVLPAGTVIAPTIEGEVEFITSSTVTLTAEEGMDIYYTIDGTDPIAKTSTKYNESFTLTTDALVKAIAYNPTADKSSAIASQQFFKIETITCVEANDIALQVSGNNILTERSYRIVAYVTEVLGEVSRNQQNFAVADEVNGTSVFQSRYCNVPEPMTVGMQVEMIGKLTKYNTTAQMLNGNITILARPAVTEPVISGAEVFETSTEVTITAEEGANIYYTLDGTDPTVTSTAYSASFSLTETKTVKAIAHDGAVASNIVEKTFSKAISKTCVEAKEIALQVSGNNVLTPDAYVVTGYVTQVLSEISNGQQRFWIADTQDGENTLQSYYCNVPELITVDMKVKMLGKLTKYNDAAQMKNGDVTILKRPAALSWSADSYTATIDAENTFPTLTNTNSVSVSYTSSDEDVATIATDGTITLVGAGSTTITASFTENATYTSASASFTLDVLAAGEVAEATGWIEAALADITSEDEVVITMTKESTTWALYSGNGTSSAPTALEVTVFGGKITSEVPDGYVWNISNNNGSLVIYPNGTTESWLYCTDANNGVRVGDNNNKDFTIDASSGYLKHTATSRYVGVYNAQDWRCYTNTTGNTADQTLKFYKKVLPEGTPDKPVVSGEVYFENTTSVTITAANGMEIYYTTDGSQPTNASTKYNAALTLSTDATVKAIAYDATKQLASEVASMTFYKTQEVSAADAATIASQVSKNNELTERKYKVVAYVTEVIDESLSNGQQRFWVADEKGGTNTLQSYYCNVPEVVAVGMKVQMVGFLTKYNTNNQMKNGDVTIIERPTDEGSEDPEEPGDDPVVPTPTVNPTATFIFNTAEGLDDLGIIYPATADEDTEGAYKTEFVDNATYTQDGITMTTTNGTSNPTRVWLTAAGKLDLRVYKGATLTFSVPAEHQISTIVFDGSNIGDLLVNETAVSGNAWTGSEQTVTFTAKLDASTIKINTIAFVVEYTRNVTNKYGSICLPYASASISGAYFYEVVGKGTEKGKPAVYLASVTELEAGVPYIFEKTANTITVTCQGEAVAEAGSANGLVGNFTNEYVVPANNYILYNNAFIPADGTTNKVNAYRAYLDLSAVDGVKPNQMPGRRYIGMSVQGENETTGVEDLFTTDAPVKVIENGQLIIIRDGVKYNVQGQVIR